MQEGAGRNAEAGHACLDRPRAVLAPPAPRGMGVELDFAECGTISFVDAAERGDSVWQCMVCQV